MLIGVPREIKRDEYRVAMLPVGVEELTRAGHQVLIEAGAGVGAAFRTPSTPPKGRRSSPRPPRSIARAELIVKVKEPLPPEYPLIRAGPDAVHLFPLRRQPRADRGDARQPGRPAWPMKRCATPRAACRCSRR